MNKNDQITAVALALSPVMTGLDKFFDKLVGDGQHNIVLVVGAGNEAQYIANRQRALSIELLTGLLARWKVGMPDTLPGAASPGDTRAFEYLLNTMELAGKSESLSAAGYGLARLEVLRYVGELIAKGNR